MPSLDQVGGDPGDEEVDDEAEAEEAQRHPPDGAVAEQVRPGDRRCGCGAAWLVLGSVVIGLDVGDLLGRHPAVLVRIAVVEEPDDHPDEADHARDHERGPPAQACDDERHQRDGDRGAHAGAGVVDARGERPLADREPTGDHFGVRRVGSALPDAQAQPVAEERRETARHGGERGEHRPPRHRERIHDPGPEFVDEPSRGQVEDRVRPDERAQDEAHLLGSEAELPRDEGCATERLARST